MPGVLRHVLPTLVIGLALAGPAAAAPVVVEGVDTTGVGVTGAVDQFRADLGTNNAAGPPQSAGRREINWDGVPDAFSAPNAFPANFFNVNSPRGVVFSTPGSAFQVSANAASGQGVRFDNINATYSATFATFSPERLFTALGSTVTDVNFFVPGTTTAAVVRGFGAVFTDVDTATGARIDFFDAGGALVFSRSVARSSLGSQGRSFLGVRFPDGPPIARVRLVSGNVALGAGVTDGGANDLVVMDDFLYAEPVVAGPDGDGIPDGSDNCPAVNNPDQADNDRDGQGDPCDADDDNDGLSDVDELARGTDPRKADSDGDGKTDGADNCPLAANADQADDDGDGIGNVCDPSPRSAVVLTGLQLKPAAFKRRRGTRVSFTLVNDAANVRFTVQRRRAGRWATVRKRSFTRAGVVGLNRFRFKPKVRRGRYRLRAVATDGRGNRSAEARRFRVKR